MKLPKKSVAILFGGVSAEHDVSIVSAASIAKSIDTERFTPVYVAIDKLGRWHLGPGAFTFLKEKSEQGVGRVILSTDPEKKGFINLESGDLIPVDVIFPVLHGPRGEDGTIQGFLEIAGIPYVGCGTMASAIAMDKDMTKRILAQRGIPVVKGTCVTRWMWDNSRQDAISELMQSIELPMFIKPATMGSSIGITRAASLDEVIRGIEEGLRFSQKVVIEKSIENPLEIEVAVLGNHEPRASLPGQIISCNEFYDFEAKYMGGSTELIIPAKLSRSLREEIQFRAVEAFDVIGGAGMARIDFLASRDTCYLNEINTIPGFTSISMYPKLWEASGIPYSSLITILIELALKRHVEQEALTKTIELDKGLGV